MINLEPNPETQLEDWIEPLPAFQRDILVQMRDNIGEVDELVDAWLGSLMIPGTTGFGSTMDRTPWSSLVRNAIHDYLCSSDQETKERRNTDLAAAGLSQNLFVGMVAAYVAPLVPLSAAFLVPAVAIVLCIAARIGVKAFCARMTEARALEIAAAENPTIPIVEGSS